jgi:hypothetical protein
MAELLELLNQLQEYMAMDSQLTTDALRMASQ